MTKTESSLHQRLEAIFIGPCITDEGLQDTLNRCVTYHDYFTAIIVNPHQIAMTTQRLAGSGVGVAGTVAYPLGNLPKEVKLIQIGDALRDGATQVDILMQIESLRAGDFSSARREAEDLVTRANQRGAAVSLIANLVFLDDEQKHFAAEIARSCGAALKTATGMGVETDLEDVRLLRETFDAGLTIVAYGAVSRAEQAIDLIQAGADKVCSPFPFAILEGLHTLVRHGYKEA